MKIATSILSIQKNIEECILKIGKGSTDFIHLDVMDGIFVPNKKDYQFVKDTLLQTKKPLDIHLMVHDIEYYVDLYKSFHPIYMTFHLEATEEVLSCIDKIKACSKVGISIKPKTNVVEIFPYLDQIDLVLLMSVEPGFGGQTFIDIKEKIEILKKYRQEKNLSFIIEIDGGINSDTIKKVEDADMVVVGSYITNSMDYEAQIRNLIN